jgi:hypothetical protein
MKWRRKEQAQFCSKSFVTKRQVSSKLGWPSEFAYNISYANGNYLQYSHLVNYILQSILDCKFQRLSDQVSEKNNN